MIGRFVSGRMDFAQKASILLLCLSVLLAARHVESQLTRSQRIAFLNNHNRYRAMVSPKACPALPAMKWDSRLEKVAQDFADKCHFAHNSARTSQAGGAYSRVGENVYLTATTAATISTDVSRATRAWHNEVRDYELASNSCAPGRVCGHYTQVVWRSSTHLGCAAKVCEASKFRNDPWSGRYPTLFIVVCNYGPAGNIDSQRPYTPCK